MNEPQQIRATLMQIGDDEDGNPRLLFHTTREQISRLKTLPIYEHVSLTIGPIQESIWCAFCGTFGDHRSGGCPALKPQPKQ